MSPGYSRASVYSWRLPRTRGDEPFRDQSMSKMSLSAPHTRG